MQFHTFVDYLTMDDKWLDILIHVIRVFVFVYDVITWPIYYTIQKPWIKTEAALRNRCRSLSGTGAGPYRHVAGFSPMQRSISNDVQTLYELFKTLVIQFEDRICLGTREILGEEDEVQSNGKIFQKFVLGNYHWNSYRELLTRIKNFSRGLRSLLKPLENESDSHTNVVLFAETRAEWIIASLACSRYNIPVVTLYANLGEDAIIHGITETEAKIVITSHELLPKFKTLLKRLPNVEHVIYMKGFAHQSLDGFPSTAEVRSFDEIERIGSNDKLNSNGHKPATRDDIAIIMYTSGSTGVPKGVVINHNSLLAALAAFSGIIDVQQNDVYLAYLPLAHVLELIAEFLCLLNGVPIGYSSPQTISDKSTKIKRGTQGDASILRPTFMASVPLILDRIYKNVMDVVNAGGPFKKRLFDFAFNYKLSALKRGYSTPIIDFVVFSGIKALLGGRVRLMVTGGAPVAPDTHDFIRVCLCCPLLQGYGLTETCACATVMDLDDTSTGAVGSPMHCCDIELVDWEEGNYRTTDKPFPRGEIVIGGANVAKEYYKLPEQTKTEFFDRDGKRWFRTGDVGECNAEGCFKIIDRKKDLVKLQYGEYVSLGKVESELKIVSLVENICVYGDSSKTFTVALVTPNAKHLEELGRKLGKNKDFHELCKDKDIEDAVAKMLQEQGKKVRLERFEIPMKVKLIPETWLPDSGLVTAAYKLKRKNIQEHYQEEIDQMYATKNPGP